MLDLLFMSRLTKKKIINAGTTFENSWLSNYKKKKKLSNKQEKQFKKKKRHTCMLSICYYVHFITSGR